MSPSDPVWLSNGVAMPRCGFGTAGFREERAERAVLDAIAAGYRSIDTAEAYGNEDAVGRAIQGSGIPRQDLFVTTKFDRHWHREDGPRQALEASLERLDLDSVDLLLIHWPNPALDGYVDAWVGMVRLLEEGRVRAIGTSNFAPEHLTRVIDATGVAPLVNQIQLNPWVPRHREREFHEAHGIVTESWGPLGLGWGHERQESLLDEPPVVAAADAHGRTPAQVVLRWHLQLGLVAIPRTQHADRMRENLDLHGFALSNEEMESITALTRAGVEVDPETFGH
jgi:2,5-diketo-D-gluconate reductase A